jgi:peptidyl-prolyl cis-trans isomerase B (cyclophilin B)
MVAKDAAKDASNDKTAANAATTGDAVEVDTTTPEAIPAKKGKYDFTKLNILSLVSLAFSIVGGAVPAIVLGHISLAQIKKTQQDGRILAIISLVLGYIQVGFWVLGGIFMAVAAIVSLIQGVPFEGLDGLMDGRMGDGMRGGMGGFDGPGMMGDFGGPGMMGENRS